MSKSKKSPDLIKAINHSRIPLFIALLLLIPFLPILFYQSPAIFLIIYHSMGDARFILLYILYDLIYITFINFFSFSHIFIISGNIFNTVLNFKELQTTHDMPQTTLTERMARDRARFKVHSDFVAASVRGALAIIDGSGTFKLSHIYLYNL